MLINCESNSYTHTPPFPLSPSSQAAQQPAPVAFTGLVGPSGVVGPSGLVGPAGPLAF